MKLTTTLTLLATILQTTNAITIQSPPFKLKITSKNSSVPNSYAIPYRVGAMIYKITLTPNPDSSPTWRLNTTTASNDMGYLTTNTPFTSNNQSTTIPFAITVSPRVGSNIAILTFAPKTEKDQAGLTIFGINTEKQLTIDGGADDTDGEVLPPKWLGALSRWVICKAQGYPGGTNKAGDLLVLGWVMGNKESEDPSCRGVEVDVAF